MPARIAVVEDDDSVRALIEGILLDRGYEVATFASIAAATKQLSTRPPDLLITDVELPDGCGLDLVGPRGEDGRRLPTIIVSSLRRETDFVRGFAAGATDYLGKPFTRDELLARCAFHLARSSAHAAPPGDEPDLPTRNGLVYGRYEIVRSLGIGGFGRVYLAIDHGAKNARVALKVLAAQAGDQMEARLRFIRETYAAAGVHHARIAAVHDIGAEQGRIYYAMEFVPGGSLGRRVTEHGSLDERRVRLLARGLLEALEAVRGAGLVHRDLKPDNVMLRGGDPADPVLVDFGLAKRPFDRGVTDAGSLVGTAAYMAPETILGRTVDHRSDLFSLGLTLRFALSGEEVFSELNGVELLRAIAQGPIPPPRRPVSPIFGAFLRSLVAVSPDDRPESAGVALGFLDALAPLPDGDETERIPRPRDHHD